MRSALMVAWHRVGSMLLAYGMDSHPAIDCPTKYARGEVVESVPFHKLGVKGLENHLSIAKKGFVRVAWLASPCITRYTEAVEYIEEHQVPVIHLVRHNALRVAYSKYMHVKARIGVTRRTEIRLREGDVVPKVREMVIPPDRLIQLTRRVAVHQHTVRRILERTGVPLLPVTYSELVGGEGQVAAGVLEEEPARRICEFLGVQYHPFKCKLRRVHPQPLSALIKNWDEMEPALVAAGLSEFLEDDNG